MAEGSPQTRQRHGVQNEEKTDSPPTVASLDGEEAKQKGSDYWDLDDDGWETPHQTSTSRPRRILKRSNTETGVAFVCHLVLMCFYIFVHVYDATVLKRSKGVGFEGVFTYGGRWKYLTYINLWLQFLFFFFCFFVDIMPYGSTKVRCRKVCDVLFTTLALPLTTPLLLLDCMVCEGITPVISHTNPIISMFVCVMFWGIYAIDREFIYPQELDKTIPFVLNHFWHTTPLLCAFAELVIVFHPYPSNMRATLVVISFSFLYIFWNVWVYTAARIWSYPFFNLIPLPMIPVFYLVCFLIQLTIYHVGKGFCYLRWKERHQYLAQRGS